MLSRCIEIPKKVEFSQIHDKNSTVMLTFSASIWAYPSSQIGKASHMVCADWLNQAMTKDTSYNSIHDTSSENHTVKSLPSTQFAIIK